MNLRGDLRRLGGGGGARGRAGGRGRRRARVETSGPLAVAAPGTGARAGPLPPGGPDHQRRGARPFARPPRRRRPRASQRRLPALGRGPGRASPRRVHGPPLGPGGAHRHPRARPPRRGAALLLRARRAALLRLRDPRAPAPPPAAPPAGSRGRRALAGGRQPPRRAHPRTTGWARSSPAAASRLADGRWERRRYWAPRYAGTQRPSARRARRATARGDRGERPPERRGQASARGSS